MSLVRLSLAPVCVVLAFGCSSEAPVLEDIDAQIETLRRETPIGATNGSAIRSLGAFSCDFVLDLTKTTEPVGAEIGRDRVLMQRFAREHTFPSDPGMLQKHIPLLPLTDTTLMVGGRYLFEGRLQAHEYEEFVTQRFMYPDNTLFLSRPAFSNAECRDWTTLAAWRFAPTEDHTVLRTERFDTGRTTLAGELVLAAKLLVRARSLIAAAEAQGYAEVHLLHNLLDHEVQVVYFRTRTQPENPDGAAFGAVASAAPLAADLAAATGLTKVFDSPSFVLTAWLPYEAGDAGAPAAWPNSPPFPSPF